MGKDIVESIRSYGNVIQRTADNTILIIASYELNSSSRSTSFALYFPQYGHFISPFPPSQSLQ